MCLSFRSKRGLLRVTLGPNFKGLQVQWHAHLVRCFGLNNVWAMILVTNSVFCNISLTENWHIHATLISRLLYVHPGSLIPSVGYDSESEVKSLSIQRSPWNLAVNMGKGSASPGLQCDRCSWFIRSLWHWGECWFHWKSWCWQKLIFLSLQSHHKMN